MAGSVWKFSFEILSNHPVLAAAIAIVLVAAIILGLLHEAILAAEILIAVLRRLKIDLHEFIVVMRNLWREIIDWRDSRKSPP